MVLETNSGFSSGSLSQTNIRRNSYNHCIHTMAEVQVGEQIGISWMHTHLEVRQNYKFPHKQLEQLWFKSFSAHSKNIRPLQTNRPPPTYMRNIKLPSHMARQIRQVSLSQTAGQIRLVARTHDRTNVANCSNTWKNKLDKLPIHTTGQKWQAALTCDRTNKTGEPNTLQDKYEKLSSHMT